MTSKILIIGDSLVLPGHLNKYEDTWLCLLKNEFNEFDFITYLRRQLTTDILVNNGGGLNGVDKMPKGADCLEFFMPRFVILQLGIVDCAPRLFSPESLEYKIINKVFPMPIREKYIKVVKRIRKRSTERAYVTPQKFEANMMNYLSRCQENQVEKVIIVGISYPDEEMILHNPEIEAAVMHYNGIYEKMGNTFKNVKVIYPLDSRRYKERIFADGYHPNNTGHRIVSKMIKEELDACLNL